MAQMAQEPKGSSSGNTKRNRSRNYCFTWNNYEKEDITNIISWCEAQGTTYTFQEEVGETTNTPHLQGLLEFKNPVDFNAIKRDLPKCHIEKCKSVKASTSYCSKPVTRVGKVFTNKPGLKIRETIRDPMLGIEPSDWQKKVLEIIATEPDQRKIYWYWESTGCTGKSTFAKHLVMKHDAVCLSGKGNDIKFALATMLDERDIKICIFDVPRCNENYISYQALEEIKNGMFFCGKYESKQIVMNPPHVFIFANFAPNLTLMSADRWVIVQIGLEKKD